MLIQTPALPLCICDAGAARTMQPCLALHAAWRKCTWVSDELCSNILCRRTLLQTAPLNVTTNTITDSPSTAAQNIRNAIADGSLQAQLTPLGLSIVPGSLGTSNVSSLCGHLGIRLCDFVPCRF